MKKILFTLLLLAAAVFPLHASAQAYGAPISHADAKRVLAAALAEAQKNNWNMVIAILDGGGNLMMFERMDAVQLGSIDVALAKAETAVKFRRPTKAFQDAVAAGGEGLRILRLPGVTPVEGGIPLLMGGLVVGSIGVSGGTSAQDAQVATAGAAMLR